LRVRGAIEVRRAFWSQFWRACCRPERRFGSQLRELLP
jgi:hypothetical protein